MAKEDVKFIDYSSKILTKLDGKISNENFDDLVKQHAKLIANSKVMDENVFIQAIEVKNSKIINDYIEGLSPNFSEEIIFNFIKQEDNKLILGATSGLMAKALQKGYVDSSQNPIVVQGLIITSDNKIVLGVRNKPKFREKLPDEKNDFKIMLCPAGYATFNKLGNVLHPFYKELKEELGLECSDLSKIELLGYNRDLNFTEGIRITFLANTNLTFDLVKKRWNNADNFWEYIELISLEFNKESIIGFLNETDFFVYSQKARGIINSSVEPPLNHIINLKYFKKLKCD